MEESLLKIGLEQGIMFLISVSVISLLYYFGKVLIAERVEKGKTRFDMTSPSIITEFIKNLVCAASKDKLAFIRNTLLINSIRTREDEVWLSVMNKLETKTKAYLDEFTYLNTPYGDLGELYGESFDMDSFEKDIKEKFFEILKLTPEEYKSIRIRKLTIYLIVEDISNIMDKYQINAATKVLARLKSEATTLRIKR